MSDTIEQKCLSKGVKLTEQRKIIARVIIILGVLIVAYNLYQIFIL